MIDLPRNVDSFIRVGYSMFSDVVRYQQRNIGILQAFARLAPHAASFGLTTVAEVAYTVSKATSSGLSKGKKPR